MENAQRLAAWAAWTTANLTGFAFHKPKKMPPLKKIMPDGRRGFGTNGRRRQTWQEQKAIVLMMNAMYGGEVKKRP